MSPLMATISVHSFWLEYWIPFFIPHTTDSCCFFVFVFVLLVFVLFGGKGKVGERRHLPKCHFPTSALRNSLFDFLLDFPSLLCNCEFKTTATVCPLSNVLLMLVNCKFQLPHRALAACFLSLTSFDVNMSKLKQWSMFLTQTLKVIIR